MFQNAVYLNNSCIELIYRKKTKMIAANNYFTQQHNRHLKIHSKQQQQIHHNVNKFVVKTSTDSP